MAYFWGTPYRTLYVLTFKMYGNWQNLFCCVLDRTLDSSHSFTLLPPFVPSCNTKFYLLGFVRYSLYLISTQFWASIHPSRPSPWVMTHLCLHCLIPLQSPLSTWPTLFYPVSSKCSTSFSIISNDLVTSTTMPTIHSHPFPLTTTPPTLITFPYSLLYQHLTWNITHIIPEMIVPMDGNSMMISSPTTSPP